MKKKISYFYYFAIIISIFIISYAFIHSTSNDLSEITTNSSIPFNNNWFYAINSNSYSETPVSLPYSFPVKKDNVLKIKSTLPINYPNEMTLSFRSSSQFVQVYIDNIEIYNYGTSTLRPFGKTPGSAWHFINIPDSYYGKTIEIAFSSPYNLYAGKINPILYGDETLFIFNIFSQNFSGLILSLFIGFIGLSLILVYFCIIKQTLNKGLFYLGLFGFVASLWSITETSILQIIFNNQSTLLLVSFLTLMLLPITFILFLYETYSLLNKKILTSLCYLNLAAFIILTLFQLTNTKDFIETISILHSVEIISILSVLVIIIQGIITTKNKQIIHLGIAFIIFFLFLILDFIRFYFNPNGDSSFFFRFGLLFFIAILTITTSKHIYFIISENMKIDFLEKLAFIDPLTKFQNRGSFEQKMKYYRQDLSHCKNLVIIIFDINNLKNTNDSLGHLAGDHLIIQASQCITTTFAQYGDCFRIGGDEFILLSTELNSKNLEHYLSAFQSSISESNIVSKSSLSIASGLAQFNPIIDKTIDHLFVRADSLMYHNKTQIKNI